MVSCGSKNGHQKDIVSLKETTCSEYAIYSKPNSQHSLGAPIWSLNEHENLHFDSE